MNKQDALTLTPNAEIISWRDLYNGLSHRKPDKSMLTDEGDYILLECKKKGDKRDDPKMVRIVHYDSAYFIRKLLLDNRILLSEFSLNDWLNLAREIWVKFQEQNKKEN